MAEENSTTPNPESNAALPQQSYREVWVAAALEVIQSLSGDTRWAAAPALPGSGENAIEMVAFLELRGDLAGIQQFRFYQGEGRAWAQVSVPPAPDAPRVRSTPLDDAERDALGDVLRHMLETATSGLHAAGWGEVGIDLRHLGPLRRTVESSEGVEALSFTHPDGLRLNLAMTMDGTLGEAIRQRMSPGTGPVPTPLGTRAPATSASRFDMLLDVELEATLRFGNRQMLLHDVAELVPGSVLELDRQIDDPVELLVGGKIIAWGEVVVVDGNYGLRINRMVQRRERMAALEAAR
ncbi:MAG: FliM/FliN family flagellar motor switch protein [Terriglobales bacterium]